MEQDTKLDKVIKGLYKVIAITMLACAITLVISVVAHSRLLGAVSVCIFFAAFLEMAVGLVLMTFSK